MMLEFLYRLGLSSLRLGRQLRWLSSPQFSFVVSISFVVRISFVVSITGFTQVSFRMQYTCVVSWH